jgi:N-hydroxyarylamine O-acetyltransferase
MPDVREAPDALSPNWTQRYLDLLGLEREAPSVDALTRIVKAHVLTIPFENVTAHLRRRATPSGQVPAPDPTVLLDAWERRAGGGVCFDIVTMAASLLRSLGYRTDLILGHISGPFGHQGMVIHLDGMRYLVDLGNGAPLFAPIPLEGVTEVRRHGLGFRFRRSDDAPRLAGHEEWIRDRADGDAWLPSCRFELQPGADADRDAGYQHHMTPGTTWVLGTITMNRSTAEAAYSLRDNTLVRYTDGGKETTTIATTADYRRVATEVFGLPGLPIKDGLAALAAHKAAQAVGD